MRKSTRSRRKQVAIWRKKKSQWAYQHPTKRTILHYREVGLPWTKTPTLNQLADVLLTPSTPSPAFGIAERSGDPLAMYLNDIFTVTVNMAGLPGISVPAGLSAEGLPLGLQIIGKAFDEETVLRAGGVLEEAAGRLPVPDAWWRA